ncbi:hypothetical protein FF011L_43630 [Roseimaritima multifibrata]|uniref:Uncharacterized protein n=1 Tax=Roseimaritima multifibrata TaxID=1930274 RepID=A0A517MKZ1_9BACT|nr:hypothetical protein [Roseimaritima multifibrata]QDS95566.1 hypothetical protein FF011L_43630 [Roseimaritima multifibrata]
MNSDPGQSVESEVVENEVNPYLPVNEVGMVALPELPSAGMGAIASAFTILTGIVISGAVFGIGMAIFALASSETFDGAAMLIPMGMLFGACWAGLFGVPVVLVGTLFCIFVLKVPRIWSPVFLRWAAIVMGGAAGFASLALLALTELQITGALFACVPAGVGASVTWIWIEPWVRRAKRRQDAADLERMTDADAVSHPFITRPDDSFVE